MWLYVVPLGLFIIIVASIIVLYTKRQKIKYFLLHSGWSHKYLHPPGVWVLRVASLRRVLRGQAKLLLDENLFFLDGIHFRDMLLGVAIGDAYGAGVELLSREWICQNVDFTRYYNERGRVKPAFTINYIEGLYTDDTEMTFGLVKALVFSKSIPNEKILLEFWQAEFNKNRNWLGICRQGHGGIKDYFLGASSLETVRMRQRNAIYPGNAPAMRAVPIGLLEAKDLVQMAMSNSEATHPHPRAHGASLAVAWAAHFFFTIKGKPTDLILFVLARLCDVSEEQKRLRGEDIWDHEFKYGLEQIDVLPDYHDLGFLPDKTMCLPYTLLCGPSGTLGADSMHTAFCALYLLKHYKDPMDTLKASIRMGGDVDSLASICLGIVGGAFGLGFGLNGQEGKGLPLWMVDCLEGVGDCQELARDLMRWYENKGKNNNVEVLQ